MAAVTRSHAAPAGLAIGNTLADPTGIRRLMRHHLARPVTALFVAAPLLSAVMCLGRPSLLLTLSGLAALQLAADLLLERIGHPISPDRLLQLS
jgi:hypothetical protein